MDFVLQQLVENLTQASQWNTTGERLSEGRHLGKNNQLLLGVDHSFDNELNFYRKRKV